MWCIWALENASNVDGTRRASAPFAGSPIVELPQPVFSISVTRGSVDVNAWLFRVEKCLVAMETPQNSRVNYRAIVCGVIVWNKVGHCVQSGKTLNETL